MIPILLAIPDDFAWDIHWATRLRRFVGGATGPSGCCDCGVIVQTDLVARILEGRNVEWQRTPPLLSDPQTVRHVPWIKALMTPKGACHSKRRAPWSDVGRIYTFGSPQACVEFFAPTDADGFQTIVDPGGTYNLPPDTTAWAVWLDYEIRCCNCYDDTPWRLTDSAVLGDDETHLFVAPPYASSVQVQLSSFAGPLAATTLEVLDAAGNVIWSGATTAGVYVLRWPHAHALRVRGDRLVVALVTWDGA